MIGQFPIFIQPYIQQLKLHDIEMVPVTIVNLNKKVQSYTYLQVNKPYITLNSKHIFH